MLFGFIQCCDTHISLEQSKLNTSDFLTRDIPEEKPSTTFKDAEGLPQAARWKAASDQEIASLEKNISYELVPITIVRAGQREVNTRSEQLLNKLNKQLKPSFGDVSRVLGMSMTRDRENGTVTLTQTCCKDELVECFGTEDCNLVFTPGAEPELSLNQPERDFLDKEGKRRCQSIVGATMYLERVSWHDVLNTVDQLGRGMSKSSQGSYGGSKAFA